MDVLGKNVENKSSNKIETDSYSKKSEFMKTHYQVNSKDKEFEIKRIKRKKLSSTNNNFNLNKNNNYIIFRHNTFNKIKEKDGEKFKEKKGNNQIRINQKTMILDQDLSKEINTLSFYYMNNTNTNKNNNINKKNIPKLNKGSTSRKESKKISKNLSRENMRGGGNNFLQGGTQRKKILGNDIDNNNKILRLYDFNTNKDENTLINNNDITFNTNSNNKHVNSTNNVILNSGNKYKVDKKVSLVDKIKNNNNSNYYKQNLLVKNDNNNNNRNINNKNNIPYKAQSNEKKIKNYMNLSTNHSKENIVKNIKNIIIENSNKNNINFMNHLKSDANIYVSYNTNKINRNNKEAIIISEPIQHIRTNDHNKKLPNLNFSSGQIRLDTNSKQNNDFNFEFYNLNNKKTYKNKNNNIIFNNINKNINNLIKNNEKKINNTENYNPNTNNFITFTNNTSNSNIDFTKINNITNYNTNTNTKQNKSENSNNIEKGKPSSKKSLGSVNNITKLNTLQNEDKKMRIKYNNKTKINFSSPKMPSLYERHKEKPHLRRPLSNNQKNKIIDKTYSPKLNSIPNYIQTENNNIFNINIKNNNNIFINRVEILDNYSISTRKNNNFSKINNNLKNNNNYINILNKRKLSAKIKNESGNSLLNLFENKDKKKEMVNLTKRRPRKFDNEVNNLFTEISNINNNKNSFFNFGFKKNNNNAINNIAKIHSKLLDNHNKEEKNKKYSFINILKPKAISQQKRYDDKKEEQEKENIYQHSKIARDLKSLTFISKEGKNEKNKNNKNNVSLINKKKIIIKLIHMMDEINNSKSKSKRKNKSYNNNHSNKRGASAIKERVNLDKFKINDWAEEDRIIENVIQNDITMYYINIISKYDDNCNKIGLAKIKLYDKNNNEIFIIFSNSNISDFGEENVNYLFNLKKYHYNNKPFISEFKDNLYIKFGVSLKKSNILKYIKIINYEDKKEKISSVKEIQIFHGKKKLFEGILNVNYDNKINISENINNSEKKDLPNYTSTRKRGFSANINKSNNSTNNILYINKSNYKRNNTRSFSTFRGSSGKKKNKIPRKKLKKTNSERNISGKESSNKNNNNREKFIKYTNTEIEDNIKYNNKNFLKHICNTIAYNNDSESNKYIRERFISDNIENETTFNILNETNIHEGININKFNLNNYNSNSSFKKDEEFNDNLPYIKFKNIRLILSSNYGHPNFIGLTGLEFYDLNNKLINIETAKTIGALPKDLHTIYNNENDNRIFENIFNGENNIDDSYNMWVTLFDLSKKEYPYIELTFNKYIYLSKMKFFNYNKKNELDICLKTVDIILDDKYYNTIHLRQGIGDIINENIIQKENSNINNNTDNNNKDNKNYCQEILFPINNDYYENISKNNHIKLENDISENTNIEFASIKYEQSYETPYIPNGQIIKFQLVSNFYKGKALENNFSNFNTNSVNNILLKNYNYIGINISKIFDENGNNLLSQKNIQYKILSNKEMIISDKNKIILNCSQNEDSNNNIYYLFETPVNISYIELNPFSFFGGNNNNKNEKNFLNSAREIKIFCDTSVIFEGEIYNYQPTIILFTSSDKILKNINENFLTKKGVGREAIETKNENCYSLLFNIE